MVRFEKFKNWRAAEHVLCRDIVPAGGTSGHFGRNRDCPTEIGTVDMSDWVLKWVKKIWLYCIACIVNLKRLKANLKRFSLHI